MVLNITFIFTLPLPFLYHFHYLYLNLYLSSTFTFLYFTFIFTFTFALHRWSSIALTCFVYFFIFRFFVYFFIFPLFVYFIIFPLFVLVCFQFFLLIFLFFSKFSVFPVFSSFLLVYLFDRVNGSCFLSRQFLRCFCPFISPRWGNKYRHIIYGWTQNLSGNTLKVVRSQSGHFVGRYSPNTGHW